MWIIRDSSVPKDKKHLTAGDYHISDDERAVYTVHKDGSLRRIKDKAVIAAVKEKLKELKAKRDEQQTAQKAPLTYVDKQALTQFAAAATAIAPRTLPSMLRGVARPARIGAI